MRPIKNHHNPMIRSILLVLGSTMALTGSAQRKKTPTVYTPLTEVRTEEVLPVAAYMIKTYYKGDIDYLAWGDRHLRSYWINYYWGLGTQCHLKANFKVDAPTDWRSSWTPWRCTTRTATGGSVRGRTSVS